MFKDSFIPILNKYNLQKDETLLIANKVLNDNLIIKYNYIPRHLDDDWEQLYYPNVKYSWQINLDSSTNMAMLHLHSLEPVSYLLLAYDFSLQPSYLEKAWEMTLDWYNHSNNSDHYYLWYRHCVAERAVVLSQLYNLKNQMDLSEDEEEKLLDLIVTHKSFLYKAENFVYHNHGLLMDMGLIALCLVSSDYLLLQHSIKRVKKNFNDTFTDNMICVENSISYSVFNIEQFIKCEKYLFKPFDETISLEFDTKMELALDFLHLILQPDNKFPHIGDGEQINLDFLKTLSIYKFYNNHLIFKQSYDNSTFKVYKEEGYIVLRTEKLYLFITAGDIKKNHKHADDLSFILFYDKEIFIDSGIYSYNNDKLREYQTSSSAHNTIVLNNETYNYLSNDAKAVEVLYYTENNSYYYIVVKNSSYSYAEIVRHFYVIKDTSTIIIYDEIKANTPILASQFFNLSKEISECLEYIGDNNSLEINKDVYMKFENDAFLEFFNGRNSHNVNAINSNKFHDYQPIIKLSINKIDKNPELLTIVSNTSNHDYTIKNKEDTLFLKTSKYSLNLQKLKVDFVNNSNIKEYINITRIGHTIFCETIAKYFEYQEYAWDIIKDGKKIDQIWYQESNKFNYTFDRLGIYSIRVYVRNISNKEEKKSFLNPQKVII